MAAQPSFDPLAQPDILAALTRPNQAPAPALGGWASFEDDGGGSSTAGGNALSQSSTPAAQRARRGSSDVGSGSGAYFGAEHSPAAQDGGELCAGEELRLSTCQPDLCVLPSRSEHMLVTQ